MAGQHSNIPAPCPQCATTGEKPSPKQTPPLAINQVLLSLPFPNRTLQPHEKSTAGKARGTGFKSLFLGKHWLDRALSPWRSTCVCLCARTPLPHLLFHTPIQTAAPKSAPRHLPCRVGGTRGCSLCPPGPHLEHRRFSSEPPPRGGTASVPSSSVRGKHKHGSGEPACSCLHTHLALSQPRSAGLAASSKGNKGKLNINVGRAGVSQCGHVGGAGKHARVP